MHRNKELISSDSFSLAATANPRLVEVIQKERKKEGRRLVTGNQLLDPYDGDWSDYNTGRSIKDLTAYHKAGATAAEQLDAK